MRPGSLVRTKSALSKTGHFLGKTESMGVGASSPLSILFSAGAELGANLGNFFFLLRAGAAGSQAKRTERRQRKQGQARGNPSNQLHLQPLQKLPKPGSAQ